MTQLILLYQLFMRQLIHEALAAATIGRTIIINTHEALAAATIGRTLIINTHH